MKLWEQIFTATTLAHMEHVQTYEELVEIAIEQLRVMHVSREVASDVTQMPIGVVCGPISNGGLGNKDLNLERFNQVVSELTEQAGGYFFSQMPYELALWRIADALAVNDKTEYPKGAGNPLLEGFYRPLFESGYIKAMYFIKGWESSDGARWERELGIALGIPIYDLDDDLGYVLVA